MMNKKLIKNTGTWMLMIIGLSLCFSSCRKHVDPGNWDIHWPIADFSFSPEVPKIGETVKLQAQSKLGSSEVTKWEWEILDSTTTLGTAEGQSTTFEFEENGSYLIRLVATDSSGNTDIVTKAIDIAETTDYFVKEGASSGGGHSWDDATNLSYALKNVSEGSSIYLAAGTYQPSDVLTNSDIDIEENKTFEISKNVKIIGGFPANATDGDVSDPETNSTTLSGDLGGGTHAFHVLVIRAPKISGKQVVLKGLTITEGVSAGSGSDITVSGTAYSTRYGAGLNIGGSNVEFVNVDIINNTTDPAVKTYGIGIFARPNSELIFRNSKLNNNKNLNGNSAAMRVDGATVYMYDCEVKGNTASGTSAGLYFNANCNAYLYNTVIANNVGHDYAPGLYLNGTEGYIVNCLITGNISDGPSDKHAGGLFLYKGSKISLISTTITDNETGGMGGGVRLQSGSNELTVFNSIIAGNRQNSGEDIDINSGTVNLFSSISGQDVYDDNGTVAGGSFDADNDFNNDFFPKGSSNPALIYGMDASALSTISTTQSVPLESDYLKEDINGKSRAGKSVMGPLVE